LGTATRFVIQGGSGIEARNLRALVSKGSASYMGRSSSSSDDWSYFHRSSTSALTSLGGLAIPRRSIHKRLRRPIRRRYAGEFSLDSSSRATPRNLKTAWISCACGLSRSIGVGSSKDPDDAEAGGVIRYCVLAGLKLGSCRGPWTGDRGPRVRSRWLRFHSLWLCTFFSMSARSSFSFSAKRSARSDRSASADRPSGRTAIRSCVGGGGRCTVRASGAFLFCGCEVLVPGGHGNAWRTGN
jgi:hypothetical protein